MGDDTAKAQARSILGPSKENELLHSYVRAGEADDAGGARSAANSPPPSPPAPPPRAAPTRRRHKKRGRREEEVYTDKDRAAAVAMGTRDIKQSLSIKNKQDRSAALHLPAEADSGTLIGLCQSELRSARARTALQFIEKALELSPDDKQALVARSRCHLLLGEPHAALADAEAALAFDADFVKAIFQKAEALYYCGEFEHSLMFYHRGMRLRPDLQGFRLGIQKAQEAIENTIGASQPIKPTATKKIDKNKSGTGTATSKESRSTRSKSRKPILGQLMVDRIFLENLLKNPDLNVADRKTNPITAQAEEAIRFLDNRAEFWRQQEAGGGGH